MLETWQNWGLVSEAWEAAIEVVEVEEKQRYDIDFVMCNLFGRVQSDHEFMSIWGQSPTIDIAMMVSLTAPPIVSLINSINTPPTRLCYKNV